ALSEVKMMRVILSIPYSFECRHNAAHIGIRMAGHSCRTFLWFRPVFVGIDAIVRHFLSLFTSLAIGKRKVRAR
ncbi:MAG: hypothetical protein ACLFQ0_20025, partial [Cyclobacteriaceae bacterium]